jgi:hypothetical protein
VVPRLDADPFVDALAVRVSPASIPYGKLVDENAHRGRHAPEYELLDTGAFAEGRYWEITVDYAKAATDDVCLRVSVRNAGPAEATIDVLPTLWFRNRWSWDPQVSKPSISESEGSLVAQDTELGSMVLSGNGTSVPPFCDNESNVRRLWGHGSAPPPY